MKTKEKAGADGPVYGPTAKPYTLSSGRPCTLVLPDLYALSSGRIDLPNSAKLDVWDLLLRYKTSDDPDQQLLADEKWARSHFYAAQLALEPRLKLDDDDQEGVIDPREVSIPDLLAIFDFCRFGPPPTAARREPPVSQDAPPFSGGLPPESE